MTIVPPTGVTVKQYVLVYQGTIGTSTGNDALDPVEANIAIATESFTELLDGGD